MTKEVESVQSVAPSALPKSEREFRPEKVQAPKIEKINDNQTGSMKVDPVEDINRLEQIGDRSLAIAVDTYSIDRIREKVKELEAALPKTSNSLVFQVDEVLKRPVITVIDKNSGEVVRTLPSDEVLRVVHNIDKMKGILFEDQF